MSSPSANPYLSQFLATELTRRSPADQVESLAGVLMDAKVDLNPHQVDAALFAFSSPLSKGAILADEVGLGKTIEAGLVIAQRWAERKRHILIIVPANLRKQWSQELLDKFYLPSHILDLRTYLADQAAGVRLPFFVDRKVLICSYQFAGKMADQIRAVLWNLVVIDEAHRMRNVYKPGQGTMHRIKEALVGKPKILLTATPLQNSIKELYGLISVIDDHVFGDLRSFTNQFSQTRSAEVAHNIRERIKPWICTPS